MNNDNKKILQIGCIVMAAIAALIVIAIITFIMINRSHLSAQYPIDYVDNVTSPTTTFSCLNSKNAAIQKVENYVFTTVMSDKKDVEWGEIRQDNGVRVLPLSEIQADEMINTVYVTMQRSDGTYINNDMDMWIQVCDKNNQTTYNGYIADVNVDDVYGDPGEGQSLMSTMQVSPIDITGVMGEYRVDTYVFYGGKWTLVARLGGLEVK